MREEWIVKMYQSIKKARTEQLSRAMSILQRKAARDPEVAEALCLLYPLVSGQEQEEKPTPMGHAPNRSQRL
jgi:precorrin-3B methylase